MKLEEIMVTNVVQIRPDETVGQAAALMKQEAVGCLVATTDGTVKGIITDRDLLGCMQQTHDPRQCKVATHMSRPVIVLKPDEDHIVAIDIMQRRRIKRLPLARDGKLVGMVSLSDLAALAEGEMHKVWASWTAVAGIMRAQAVQVWATRQWVETGEKGCGETRKSRN
jgi:CBS domain-containing protein